MSDPAQKTLVQKLAAIRKDIGKVEMRASDGEDPFPFAPADAVFDLVRRQLRLKKVLAVPAIDASAVGRVLARITLIDEENAIDRLLVGPWPGEASPDENRPTAKASTNALKGALMAFFLIGTVEPPDFGPPVNGTQLHDVIWPAAYAAGLQGHDLLPFMQALPSCGELKRIEYFPRGRLTELLDALHERRQANEAAVVDGAGAAHA